MAAKRGNNYASRERKQLTPMERFLSFCRFQPETGCVLWDGGTTCGRGHHIPYPSFWFDGKRWLGHRWAAKFIHGLDIENYHVDHYCPELIIPNTLCVAHLQTKTLLENVKLQHQRRKHFIHLEVGLTQYREVYGHEPGAPEPESAIPFFTPPAWFAAAIQGPTHERLADTACPF